MKIKTRKSLSFLNEVIVRPTCFYRIDTNKGISKFLRRDSVSKVKSLPKPFCREKAFGFLKPPPQIWASGKQKDLNGTWPLI